MARRSDLWFRTKSIGWGLLSVFIGTVGFGLMAEGEPLAGTVFVVLGGLSLLYVVSTWRERYPRTGAE